MLLTGHDRPLTRPTPNDSVRLSRAVGVLAMGTDHLFLGAARSAWRLRAGLGTGGWNVGISRATAVRNMPWCGSAGWPPHRGGSRQDSHYGSTTLGSLALPAHPAASSRTTAPIDYSCGAAATVEALLNPAPYGGSASGAARRAHAGLVVVWRILWSSATCVVDNKPYSK